MGCGEGELVTETPFAEMLRFNEWANRTLFDACRALDDAQLDERAAGISASVRELLTHIATGQQTIVVRMAGGQQPSWAAWPGFDALEEALSSSGDELMTRAEALEANSTVEVRRGEAAYLVPESFFLVLALAHGVEHRTEIKIALNAIGVSTPDLDSWAYGEARGFKRAV